MTTANRLILLLTICPGAVDAATLPQGPEAMPTEHSQRIAPGAYVDLDTGLVLPRPEVEQLRADLFFDRDGSGFYVDLPSGGMPAAQGSTQPVGEWSEDRIPLGSHDAETRSVYLRTDRGSVARVSISINDPYSTASAILQWVLAPAGVPVFEPGPDDVRAAFVRGVLAVSWVSPHDSAVVEIIAGDKVRKLSAKGQSASIPGLSSDGIYRVHVRSVLSDGVISLPGSAVVHGRQQPVIRGVTHYPDRFYNGDAGLSLPAGQRAGRDADVVFYLYGVYVPGGGVRKLGTGERAFRSLGSLPSDGYLPSYGRLDEGDVLAVRMADGRHAALWLVPTDGRDVRSGMQVHYAFLPDGRRDLMPAPEDIAQEVAGGKLELRWSGVQGARRYRVEAEGGKPIVVNEPRATLHGLARNREHEVAITAIGDGGDESAPLRHRAHTFDEHHRVSAFELVQQAGGYRFVDEVSPKDGFDISFESFGGNISSLRLRTPHGSTRAASFGTFELGGDAAEEYHFDDRDADSAILVVRTGDGGVASLRIGSRTMRQKAVVAIDYVYRPGNR